MCRTCTKTNWNRKPDSAIARLSKTGFVTGTALKVRKSLHIRASFQTATLARHWCTVLCTVRLTARIRFKRRFFYLNLSLASVVIFGRPLSQPWLRILLKPTPFLVEQLRASTSWRHFLFIVRSAIYGIYLTTCLFTIALLVFRSPAVAFLLDYLAVGRPIQP